jgi:iron complex outermembrane recepter protein
MWAPDTNVIEPETSGSYEIGLKSQSFDNRLRVNLALFSAKYDNYQTMLPELLGATTVYRLVNAGQVGTSGLEADVTIKPGARWEIVGALAETRARVVHFNCAASLSSCVEDGSSMPFAPRHRLTLGTNYRVPLANGQALVLGGDYRWQSEVQFQLPQSPYTMQSAYGIVNASVALDDAAHGWRLTLLAKNLANKSYAAFLTSQFDGLARLVPRDDERYFGINFRKDF